MITEVEEAPEQLVPGPLASDDWRNFRPLLRKRVSSRPPDILPEIWNRTSKKKQLGELQRRAQLQILSEAPTPPATAPVTDDDRLFSQVPTKKVEAVRQEILLHPPSRTLHLLRKSS